VGAVVVRYVACVALAGLLAGCELFASIPGAVGGDPTLPDAPPGTVACESDVGCMPPVPRCELGGGVCVACLGPADCADPIAPVCDAFACRACVADADCASTVCLGDGSCADPARVIYASAAGAGTCGLGDPCQVETALGLVSATRDIVKLAPETYQRTVALAVPQVVTIAGRGATFQSQLAGFESVLNTSGNVTIVGLVMLGAAGSSAIMCTAGSLALREVRLDGGLYGGAASACAFTADRLTIVNMQYYGYSFSDGSATITNSVIARNGGQSIIGGLYFYNVPSGAITHTTIADNQITDGSGFGALYCMNSLLAIDSNIVFGNEAPQIDPQCSVSYSIVDGAYVGGTGNQVADPLFVSAATGDYHLQAASPARQIASPASTATIDFDGEARPQPAATPADAGADEVP
jgi:hypothetical protein